MNQLPEVIVTGLNVVEPDEKCLSVGCGSTASDAAKVMAALGRRVAFIVRLGDDTLSQTARTNLTHCGVLEDAFIHDPAARPAVAVVDNHAENGDRTVSYDRAGYRDVSAADVKPELARGANLVVIDSYQPDAARELLTQARANNIRSVLDLQSGEPATLRELIALGTDVILPKTTAVVLCGGETNIAALLTALTRITAGTVIITDGVNGSWASGPEGTARQKAFKANAFDTLACYGGYHGAYAVALLEGLKLRERMEFAAYITARLGAGPGVGERLPTMESLTTADLSMLSPALRDHFQSNV